MFEIVSPDKIKSYLMNGWVDLEFIKKDGSLRKFRATLCPEFLPPVDPDKPVSKKKKSVESQSVYVDDNGDFKWRSFRWDSLKKFNGNEIVLSPLPKDEE